MKPAFSRTVTVLVVLFLSAASTLAPTTAPPQSPQTIAPLKDRVAALEKKLNELTSLHVKLAEILLETNVPLDCNSHTASPIRVQDGTLIVFVSCLGIEPYLEGHRVSLKIGNPYFAQFSGFSGSLFYGGTTDTFGTVDFSSLDEIRAGSSVLHSVIINPSDPKQLRQLRLTRFEIGVVKLIDSAR